MTFIDTNILLYAFGSGDGTDRPGIARQVLARGDLAFSIQVFQEFHVQATSSRRVQPLTQAESKEVIEALAEAFTVQVNDLAVFRTALEIQVRYQTSFWDANILAAARILGCSVVLSEDLNDRQDFGGVTVRNPFAEGYPA